jgi:hypothetical protein
MRLTYCQSNQCASNYSSVLAGVEREGGGEGAGVRIPIQKTIQLPVYNMLKGKKTGDGPTVVAAQNIHTCTCGQSERACRQAQGQAAVKQFPTRSNTSSTLRLGMVMIVLHIRGYKNINGYFFPFIHARLAE